MSKLKELIKSLKANYIVIVENDFGYITDPIEILGHLAISSEHDAEQIFNSLKESGKNELAGALEKFRDDFQRIETHNSDLSSNLLPNNLQEYLKEIHQNEILSEELVSSLEEAISNDNGESISEIFLRHGILTTTQIYDDILKELKNIPEVRIAYFRSKISPTEMDDFKDLLNSKIEQTNSMFWIAIVDKMLNGESGVELIDEFLELDQKLVGFILTSDANDNEPERYGDYFKREISKDDPSILATITQRLAEAAYAEVFHSIQEKYLASSKDALNTVLKNQKNIKHIVAKAHAEGIPAYDAIKYWFELAAQKGVDKLEVEDFKFIGGLTSFFNDSYLSDHPSIHSISDELSTLNTYELFDTTLNSKHLSIAPGDIWYSQDKYYILVGQLCDLLLRENDNSRNAKLVEFLEVQLTNHTEDGKDKFYINVDHNGTKTVKIENFPDPVSGDVKMLEIKISTPTTFYADPKILDLGMFNENGECKLSFAENLPDSIVSVLPTNKERYYKNLQSFFIPIKDIIENGTPNYDPQILFGLNSASLNENVVEFGLKRVARLRGRYFDSLYNNFLNNKGRVDLNLIENAPETSKLVEVHIKFIGKDDSLVELNNINLWERKGRYFIRKKDLLGSVPDEFIDLLKVCDEEMEFGTSKKHEILQEGNIVKVDLYYNMGNGKYHKKREFSYSDLFKGNQPKSNPNFQLADGSEESFLDDRNRPRRKLTLEELEEGVFVHEQRVTLIIENGCIKRVRD